MKRIVGSIVVAILAGAVCWFFGLGILPSLVVVLVVGALGVLLGVLGPTGGALEWPLAPPQPNDGARRETAELSWALRTRSGVVSGTVILRIRRIAVTRLAARRLDLDNPAHRRAIEALVGARFYALMNPGSSRQLVRLPVVLGALDILERLDRTDPPAAR
jgi:hypothetical protein